MKPNTKKALNSYRRLSGITVVAVYFLILVGGIVRSTGSGMGCPDWPKCFGSVIPPTDVNELPANYQEIYLEKRLAKNEKFIATLNKLGFNETAVRLANDKSIQIEEEFNATKTWIEYINRLIGVVIGLLIVATLIKSFSLWSVDKWIPGSAFISLVLVLFTGWIGSIVVSTNLLAWMITVHMLLAIALVAVLVFSYYRASRLVKEKINNTHPMPKKILSLLLVACVLMFIQVVLGTQVREGLDRISFSMGNLFREEWLEKVGIVFYVHRSFSLLLLLTHLLYFIGVAKLARRGTETNFWNQVLLFLLVVEISSGVGMAYFGIPPYLQPIHLLVGTLILGVQFILILELKEQSTSKLYSQA